MLLACDQGLIKQCIKSTSSWFAFLSVLLGGWLWWLCRKRGCGDFLRVINGLCIPPVLSSRSRAARFVQHVISQLAHLAAWDQSECAECAALQIGFLR